MYAGKLIADMKIAVLFCLALGIVVLNGLYFENLIDIALQNGRVFVLCFISRT